MGAFLHLAINLLLSAATIYLAAYYLPGVSVDGPQSALLAAVVLGVFNAVLKPVLTLITLPINIVTLGLFSFVITIALTLLATRIVPGFTIDGIGPAILFSIALSLITTVLHALIPRR